MPQMDDAGYYTVWPLDLAEAEQMGLIPEYEGPTRADCIAKFTEAVGHTGDPSPDSVPITPTAPPFGPYMPEHLPEGWVAYPHDGLVTWKWGEESQDESLWSTLENMRMALKKTLGSAVEKAKSYQPRALRWLIQALTWTFGLVIIVMFGIGAAGVALAVGVVKALDWAEEKERE